MSGFSLDDFKLADESDLNIRNPAGQPSGWIWTFAGPGHPRTITADEQQTKRALAIAEDQEKTRVNGKKWKGSGDTVEDVRDRNISYIVARLIRWSDGMTVDGQPFACTPENARTVLLDPSFGFYEQVNAFLTDERTFTPRSPKT